MKAVRYKSVDQAREVLEKSGLQADDGIFDDEGSEPQGLLTVIPEDRLPESDFYRLLESGVGVLVNVEKLPYSGFGPPALEEDYMGFVSEQFAYVLTGCALSIQIADCPQGARDIHHLEALVLDNAHVMNRQALAEKLELPEDWEFEDLFDLVAAGSTSGDEIDALIHETAG